MRGIITTQNVNMLRKLQYGWN